MDTKPIEVFKDRISTAALSSKYPDVLSSLREMDLIRNENQVHFCGLVVLPDSLALFIPRSSSLEGEGSSACLAASVLSAIDRYSRDKTAKISPEDEGDNILGADSLKLAIDIMEDYVEYGLYARRQTERTVNHGKPDWKRTIYSSRAYPTGSGPIYLDVIGTRKRIFTGCETARIHARVMRELQGSFGWLVTKSDSPIDFSLIDVPEPIGSLSAQIGYLKSEIQSVYAEREIFLIRSLIQYLERKKGSDSSPLVIGVREFHGMWEHILRETLSYVYPINNELPLPVYNLGDQLRASPRNRQRTDIVLQVPEENQYVIVDAKYYAANGVESAPGWPDLVKQYFYTQAIQQVRPDATVKNYFVFPGESGGLTSIHMSREEKKELREEDLMDDLYPVIHCLYQEPLEVISAYNSRKKLNHLSDKLIGFS